MIGIKVPAGHHTVSMKYTPPGFNTGVLTLILGIIILVMFFMYDKKHNKVLLAKKKANELIKSGEADKYLEEIENAKKTANTSKKKKIIKSKGAVAEEPLKKAKDKAEKAAETAEELADDAKEAAEDVTKKAKKAAKDIKEKAEDIAEEAEEKISEAVETAEEAVDKAEDTVKQAAPKSGKKKKKK